MSDSFKHASGAMVAFAGGTGGMTLARVNEYGACVCWIIGTIAGLCTIHSWWLKRRKHKEKSKTEGK